MDGMDGVDGVDAVERGLNAESERVSSAKCQVPSFQQRQIEQMGRIGTGQRKG